MPNKRTLIPVTQPFPWREMLAYLSWRSTPGLESTTDGFYKRQTASGEVAITYEPGCLAVSSAVNVSAKARLLFDTNCNIDGIHHVLGKCPLLGPRLRSLPGLRIPGCWEPFELCMRVILGQQVSVKGASTLMGRLGALCPDFLASQIVDADLSKLGVPQRRAETIRSLAQAAVAGNLEFGTRSWEENASALRSIPGIGPWTVDYLAIRLGRDPDAFPETDLGLLRAAHSTSPRELLRLADKWRPFRAYAAIYLWTMS
jgi:3-methyladenine DNA glycosylase/8-oxoguanine DNA glycosylase